MWGWSEAAAFTAGIVTTSAAIWERSRILKRRKVEVIIPELDEATEQTIRSRVAEVAGHAGNPIGGSLAAAAMIDRERRRAALDRREVDSRSKRRWCGR